jgi:hypothetical protein
VTRATPDVLTLTPLYAGAPTMADLLTIMHAAGFEMLTLLPGFADQKQARLLQADLIFRRAGAMSAG